MTLTGWFRRKQLEEPVAWDAVKVQRTGNEATCDPTQPPVRCSILPAEPPPDVLGETGPAAEFWCGVPAEQCTFTPPEERR